MSDNDNAQPYGGDEKIVVAIDLGTTHSQRQRVLHQVSIR